MTTRLALRVTADQGAIVHAIDPAPHKDFDADQLREQHRERFVFHRALSRDVLDQIRDADAVLLDGDHNWYTAYNELTTIARVAAEEERPFPLTLMHDVEWPYARRDMYYEPENIPEEYRHRYARRGMLPGREDLVDGGINAENHNALVAGGPRNGVLTAIEDFLAEVQAPVSYKSVSGFFGLGILFDERQLDARPALRDALSEIDSPQWLREQCARIEHGRMLALVEARNARRVTVARRREAREQLR